MKPLNQLEIFSPDTAVNSNVVYYLLRDGVLQYIGQTCDLRRRYVNHKKNLPFDTVLFERFTTVRKMFKEESAAIQFYKPPLNKIFGEEREFSSGRKPAADPKIAITVYIETSKVKAHGGVEKCKAIILEVL